MEFLEVKAYCVYPEASESVNKCIDLAKQCNVTVTLFVSYGSKHTSVMITKTSKQEKVVRFIQSVLKK